MNKRLQVLKVLLGNQIPKKGFPTSTGSRNGNQTAIMKMSSSLSITVGITIMRNGKPSICTFI